MVYPMSVVAIIVALVVRGVAGGNPARGWLLSGAVGAALVGLVIAVAAFVVIREAGREPVERDTFYREVQRREPG